MKNQFADEPEGLRQLRDHRWKALSEENSDLLGIFLCDPMMTSYFLKHVKTGSQQKYTRQNQIRLVKKFQWPILCLESPGKHLFF